MRDAVYHVKAAGCGVVVCYREGLSLVDFYRTQSELACHPVRGAELVIPNLEAGRQGGVGRTVDATPATGATDAVCPKCQG